jgi:hypothetical protein
MKAKKPIKEGRPLITISNSRGSKIVRISYLAEVTPDQLAEAVDDIVYERADLKGKIVIVTDDATPCYWACAMLVASCPLTYMIAIETRRGEKKSCLVVRHRRGGGRNLFGKYISNPDGVGNPQRHTGVAKKS